MKSGLNENDKPIPVFNIYLRTIMGIAIILIGSYSLFQLVFAYPSIKNEQESFLNSFFSTLFIGFGIWLIAMKNQSVGRDLSKPRLIRSLLIMIGVILALVAITFFFD